MKKLKKTDRWMYERKGEREREVKLIGNKTGGRIKGKNTKRIVEWKEKKQEMWRN